MGKPIFLSLDHREPIIFVTSQWQNKKKNIAYLVYRWTKAFFLVLTLVALFVSNCGKPGGFQAKWFIYVTNWIYLLCTFEAILSACMSETNLKWYKLYWVSNIIATDGSILITLIYWSCVYDPKTEELNVFSYLQHLALCLLMLVNHLVIAHPVRIRHFHYPMAFFTCYAIFTLIYFEAGGKSKSGNVFIYTVMDWRQPWMTLIKCGIILVVILMVHGFTWGLYKLRTWIYLKCRSEERKFASVQHHEIVYEE